MDNIIENFSQFLLLNIGYAEHNADWNYKQVVSPFTRIYMVDKGEAKIHLPTRTVTLTPGYLYIIPAYCMHNYECHDYFSLIYIHLYEEDINHPSIGENYNFQNQIPLTEVDALLVKHLLQINPNKYLRTYNPKHYDNYSVFMDNISVSKNDSLASQIETGGILQILMSHFLKYAILKSDFLDGRIAKILLFIRSNLHRPIEVAELAKLACVTPEHFTRLFTEEVGESPIKYIQLKKIQRAQLLLTIKKIPVKEAAYAVGFNDVSYFNRVFKKLIGSTPKEYKEHQIEISTFMK